MYHTRTEKDRLEREEKFKKQLFEISPNLELVGKYINSTTKVEVKCNKCGEEHQIVNPRNLINGDTKCIRCNGIRRVLVGYNDYATTHPNHTLLLKDKEEAKTFTHSSTKRVDTVCPICGTEKNMRVADLTKHGICCPKCSDKISYPNKFMWNLLSQLKIDFENEVVFDWSQNKRYDFVVERNIIEMDGGFHKGSKYNSYETVKEIDDLKDELAISNGYNIIRIECYTSDFEYIKNKILDSELKIILEIDNVNWVELEKELITNNLVKVASNIFNEYLGIKNISDMAKLMNVTTAKFSAFLRTATRIGLANYNATDSKNGAYDVSRGLDFGKECICLNDGKTYPSCKEAEKEYNLTKDSVGRICRGDRLSCHNFRFDFINTTKEIQDKKKSMEHSDSKPSHSAKKVICVETGQIYNSSVEASKILGMGNGYVSNLMRKHRKTKEGYTFKYI